MNAPTTTTDDDWATNDSLELVDSGIDSQAADNEQHAAVGGGRPTGMVDDGQVWAGLDPTLT